MRDTLTDPLTVRDVMRRPPTVAETMPVATATRLMAKGRTDAAPVIDARGRYVGLFLPTDIGPRVAADGMGPYAEACAWSEWQMHVDGANGANARI